MILTVKQTIALDYLEDSETEEIYYGGAAGGGKSVIGCYWVLKMCLKYPGTRWLMGRSELKNLKKTTLNSFFEVCKIQGLSANIHFHLNSQDSIIKIFNGSEILLTDLCSYPSDPEFDSLGSLEISGAFIDEAPQITDKAKNIVKSRIRYKINEYGLTPKLLMTGNPSKGWPYEQYYKPSKEGEIPNYRKFVQALPGDNPNLPESYINSLNNLDKNSKERLLKGNWEYEDDPSALIDFEKILDCFTNIYVEPGETFITVDVARFGNDRTVICIWKGFRAKLTAYKHLSIPETVEKIKALQIQYKVPNSRTLADEDGVGGGVVDMLGCKGFVNNSRALDNPITRQPENYYNLKSQCYFKLADRINKGELYIDCEDITMKASITQELEYVKQYNMDKDGKKQVLPKDKIKLDIGRSPDFADTLMMREYFELIPKMTWAVI